MVSIKILSELILLLIMSIQDYNTQKIHCVFLIAFTILGVIFGSILHNGMQLLLAVICGIGIFGAGFVVRKMTDNGVGMGDIWLMSSLSLWEYGDRLLSICILAVILSGLYSIIIYLWQKTQKTIAFVPWVGISSLIFYIV